MLMEQHLEAYPLKKLAPEKQRVARRFALLEVAGELAVKLGIIDLTVEEILAACRQLFQLWSTCGDVLADEVRGAINVRNFILRHGSRFQRLDSGFTDDISVRDRAGYVGFIDGHQMFLLTPEGFREACGGKSRKDTASVLQKAGLLHTSEAERYTTKITIGTQRPRLVAIHEKILEYEFGEAGASGHSE